MELSAGGKQYIESRIVPFGEQRLLLYLYHLVTDSDEIQYRILQICTVGLIQKSLT